MSEETTNEVVEEVKAPEAGATQEKPEPKFTQEDVNGIIKAQTEKAQKKLFKDLGISDIETGKEGFAKYKEFQDSQKSEVEKLTGQNTELSSTNEALLLRAETAELKMEAMGLGVPTDKLDKVLKLAPAYDGETPADRMKALLEDLPELKGSPKTAAPGSFSGPTGGKTPDKNEVLSQAARKAMGLS